MTEPVLAAAKWTTNAQLIGDCVRLRYIRKTSQTADLTYGKGVWWNEWEPRTLVKHDIILDGVDFRSLPEDDDTYDVVAFDPPYTSVGGRATSGIQAFYAQYGLMDAPKSPAALQRLINQGLDETYRVLKPKGIALVKVADYISSGKLWLGVHWTLEHLMEIGFEPIDLFYMIGDPRPQPKRTRKPKIEGGPRVKSRQVHARRNVSTLVVARKGKFRIDLARRRINS